MDISNKAKVISPKFIGENVVIEDGVFIDEGCYIGHNVVIQNFQCILLRVHCQNLRSSPQPR